MIRRDSSALILATVITIAGVGAAFASEAIDLRPYESAKLLVDVDHGRRMNVYCSGSGSPTIILDAAIGSTMLVWDKVQPRLALSQRVCSYDRAGYGFSDAGGPAHTTIANVTDLSTMLRKARIAPPYVLVAHSLNAFDVSLFTDRYRRDVAGIVLIDPSETGESRFANIFGSKAFYGEIASDEKGLKYCDDLAHRHKLRVGDECIQPAPSDARQTARFKRVELEQQIGTSLWDAIVSEHKEIFEDAREVTREHRPFGKLPMMVLTASDFIVASSKAEAKSKVQATAAIRLWKVLRDEDAARSDLGVDCYISGSQHYLQIDKPSVVVAAIEAVISASKSRAKPSCVDL